MATVLLPLLVLVAGALLYALAANPKLSEMGRLAFFAGLFWCVYLAARVSLHLG